MILQYYQVEEILYDIGIEKIRRMNSSAGKYFRFCCPFHGEKNPSAGIVVASDGVYGQCFSCEETYSLPKLIAECMGTSYEDGVSYLEERFNATYRSFRPAEEFSLRRYDDTLEDEGEEDKPKRRKELPRSKLGAFRSGKETHKYFFERGFNKEDVESNLIGWDRILKRVTIPLFHRDGVLAGFSGRSVLGENHPKYQKIYGKYPKYFLYDHVPIGEILYGAHDFVLPPDKTAIIVEGLFDRMWYKKMGFSNSLATIIAKIAYDKKNAASIHRDILHELGVEKLIFLQDADKAGRDGKERMYQIMKDDFICYDATYPEEYKDVMGDPENGIPPMTRDMIQEMLDNKVLYGKTRRELPRL